MYDLNLHHGACYVKLAAQRDFTKQRDLIVLSSRLLHTTTFCYMVHSELLHQVFKKGRGLHCQSPNVLYSSSAQSVDQSWATRRILEAAVN